MNSFWLTEDYIFANDILRFLTGHFKKNVKSQVFLNLKKNIKYVFSNTDANQPAKVNSVYWQAQNAASDVLLRHTLTNFAPRLICASAGLLLLLLQVLFCCS